MKGMSWARWRLMEYKKKIADKVQKCENNTTAVVKENKDKVINETTTKEIVIPGKYIIMIWFHLTSQTQKVYIQHRFEKCFSQY